MCPTNSQGQSQADISKTVAALIENMSARGLKLAIAESLTGGALASAVVDEPGASAILLGAIVAYDTALKQTLLSVDRELLVRVGAVDAEVAKQMAAGVRSKLAAAATLDSERVIGLACTGVAGPDSQDGVPVGTVLIAVDGPAGAGVQQLRLEGTRAEIRSGVVAAALVLLTQYLAL